MRSPASRMSKRRARGCDRRRSRVRSHAIPHLPPRCRSRSRPPDSKRLERRRRCVAGFSKEFLAGMTEEHRARRLGDVGANDPWQWEWGGPGNAPHVVVMFFAEPGGIGPLVRSTTAGVWNQAFALQRVLGTADLDGVEPFGFADGVSQPVVDWSQERDRPGHCAVTTATSWPSASSSSDTAMSTGSTRIVRCSTRIPRVPDCFPRRTRLTRRTLGRNGTLPGDAPAQPGRALVLAVHHRARPVEIRSRPRSSRRRSSAARARAIPWCRFSPGPSPVWARSPTTFVRTNSRSMGIRRESAVPLAPMCAGPIRATRISSATRPASSNTSSHHSGSTERRIATT